MQPLRRAGACSARLYVANRVKAMNESIYYSIDTLHEALGRAKQVSFLYSEWTAEKKLRYRHGGRRYFVSPYALVWEDENYYLIAYDAAARRHPPLPRGQDVRHRVRGPCARRARGL